MITSAAPGTRRTITEDDMTHGRPPVTIVHCGTCAAEYVLGESHRCVLSASVQAKINAARAAERAAEARRHAPIPCPDCSTPTRPGESHLCRLRRDRTVPSPLSQAAAIARAAGYALTPKDK